MPDIIDEISKIKEAEKERDRIISSANKRAEEIINSAKSELSERLAGTAEKENGLRKESEESFGRTYSLMLNKLEKDYKRTAEKISKIDIDSLSERMEKEILVRLRNYELPSATKGQ